MHCLECYLLYIRVTTVCVKVRKIVVSQNNSSSVRMECYLHAGWGASQQVNVQRGRVACTQGEPKKVLSIVSVPEQVSCRQIVAPCSKIWREASLHPHPLWMLCLLPH